MGRRTTTTAMTVTGAAIGVVLAACGSGSGGSSGAAGSATPSMPAAGSTAPSGSAATVTVRTTSLGQVLADGQGRTLYLLTADKGTTSSCTGGCVAVWPPATTAGAPVAGPGVTAGLLGTTTRSGGGREVTYNGHPLYRYSGDGAAGDVAGEGITSFGGTWYVLSPAGSAVTAGSSAPSRPGY
jgi:predicted lipoprotein with Yx(FWY)xxD motif